MAIYDIRYFDHDGSLRYEYSVTSDNDKKARIIANALNLPEFRNFEIRREGALVYSYPSRARPTLRLFRFGPWNDGDDGKSGQDGEDD